MITPQDLTDFIVLYLIIGLFLFVVLAVTFPILAKAKPAYKARETEGIERAFWTVAAALFIVGDFAFSVLWGQPIVLRQFPKLILFTKALKIAKVTGSPYQRAVAESWCKELNQYDPGHC